MGQSRQRKLDKEHKERELKMFHMELPSRILKAIINIILVVPLVFVAAAFIGFSEDRWVWEKN